jgi:uncharacterized membrane protein YdbT with pleckstrin-like domain
MGKFVDENLGAGETVRYSARVSLWRYALIFLVGAGLVAGSLMGIIAAALKSPGAGIPSSTGFDLDLIILVIGACILAWPFLARRSTELVVTDKRLIVKYGIISTQSIEIRFDKIETVRVKQGLMGRILGYGDIVVTGTGSTFDPIPNIANAMRFRAALNQAMDPGAAA